MHLYDANTMQELDAWSVDEAVDERFAQGFGDLSVHETANDPETNLAYAVLPRRVPRRALQPRRPPGGGRPLHRHPRQQLLGRPDDC